MTYVPALPNAFDVKLIAEKIAAKYFPEYLGQTPLSVFMGTTPSQAIQVLEMVSGEGMSYRVALRRELDYENPVKGFNQLAGSEQPITFYEDTIHLELIRFADKVQGSVLVKQMTPQQVLEAGPPLLMNVSKRYLVKSILDAGTMGLYNPAQGGTGPLKDRSVYAGVAYKDKIYAGVKTMTGPTYDKSGLSVAHLRKLKSLAITGGASFEGEAKLQPVTLSTKKGFPEECYIYLMDTDSYVSLSQDPEWKDFVYRGIIQGKDQPEGLSGARYRGMVDGIMVYECPELSRYRIRIADGQKQVSSWNLFLGAQAFALCWGKRPWFETESRDFNLNKAVAVCEIRGQKALQFPSFQNPQQLIERGIIHSFTQIPEEA